MVKKRINLSLEEDLVNEFKETNLNLSQTVNTLLRNFLDLKGSTEYRIRQEIIEKQKQAQQITMEIGSLEKQLKMMRPISKEGIQERIWIDFRVEWNHNKHNIDNFDADLKEKAVAELGESFERLCEITRYYFNNVHRWDEDNWRKAKYEYENSPFRM